MHILKVHNFYQQPGGEDQSFRAEIALLESYNHKVTQYTAHNDAIHTMGRADLVRKTIWNDTVYRDLRTLIRCERPDLVHFENTFPLISPAAYYAAQHEGIPVIQSLRNYRLFCANSYFLRNGHVCEDCEGKKIPISAIMHRCYRDSHSATAVVVALQVTHRALQTWKRQVDLFITLTSFGRDLFIRSGLPANKIVVKPNFVVKDPGQGDGSGNYALFVGRLSPEKGLVTLLDAWKQIGNRLPLKIVGEGPLVDQVTVAAKANPAITWLGWCTPDHIVTLMHKAKILVFPSIWYEGFPRVIVEAYASGLPVITSNLGNMASLVEHGVTGLHFQPGSSVDLEKQIIWATEHPQEMALMRQRARETFEANYTAEQNYEQLMQIYKRSLQMRVRHSVDKS